VQRQGAEGGSRPPPLIATGLGGRAAGARAAERARTCTHKREQYTQTQNGARSTFASFDQLHRRFAASTRLRMGACARAAVHTPCCSYGGTESWGAFIIRTSDSRESLISQIA
jgi:hypothetical protein